MNFRRLLYSKIGVNIISILLGLGLATLFRKACKDRSCIVFKGPELSNITNKTFQYGDACYTYEEKAQSCEQNKKIIPFA